MKPVHPLKEIAMLHGLVARLDGTVNRWTDDFAALGSPPSGSGGATGGLGGASGRAFPG